MILEKKIFRAYDIRGEAFTDFDEDGFFAIAAAFGKYISDTHTLCTPKIFVSGDGRLSMDELWPAVVAGLQSVGCQTTWGGIIPTPMNSFAFHQGSFDGAIQISASHNPAGDNGLKLTDKNGSVCGEQIQTIRHIAECQECRKTRHWGTCTNECETISYLLDYKQKLHDITPPQTPLKVIVDAGNGVSGLVYPDIFRSFQHQVEELFCDLDTSFPNHQPDPEEPQNMQTLIRVVREKSADIGFAFDGDGDRVGVVLSNGEIISADKILYVLAADFLQRHPNEKIVVDVMTSSTLMEKLKNRGGKVLLSPTGHSHISNTMRDHGAKLGGEQSGHEFLGEDFYGHDDAMLASLRFISSIQNHPQLREEITTQWPTLVEYSEKFIVPDEKKFEILEIIRNDLLKQFQQALTLDGVRIDFGKGEWGIIRCSNTSPKISVRIETQNKKSMNEKKKWFLDAFEKAKKNVL